MATRCLKLIYFVVRCYKMVDRSGWTALLALICALIVSRAGPINFGMIHVRSLDCEHQVRVRVLFAQSMPTKWSTLLKRSLLGRK